MQIEPTISELTWASNQLEDDIQYFNNQIAELNVDLETTYATFQNLTMELRQHKADNKVEHEYFEHFNQNILDITKDLLDIAKAQQKQIQIYKYWLCALTVATAVLLLIALL